MTRTLAHDLLLLSLVDGRRAKADKVAYGAAGAVLADLALAGRIDVEGSRVVVRDPTPTGVPLCDEILALVTADRPRRAQRWVEKLRGRVARQVLADLLHAGVLTHHRDRVLGFFPVNRYHEPDDRDTATLRRQLSDLLAGAQPDQPRQVLLLSLVQAIGLGGTVFPGVSGRRLKGRLRELDQHAWPSEAVRKAVQAAQSAGATAAATATVVASSAAASSG